MKPTLLAICLILSSCASNPEYRTVVRWDRMLEFPFFLWGGNENVIYWVPKDQPKEK